MPRFDAEGSAILTRLSRSRVCSDETGIRVDGRICWNWVFQNNEVVIQLIRHSLGSGVVSEVMGGHRPALWVSDLYSARQGYADDWQICPAHQLRDCQFVVDAGDSVFAPRMKMLLLRAFVLARRRQHLAESMRRQCASAWTVTSTPSWPWHLPRKMAAKAIWQASIASVHLSIIARSNRITTAANANHAQQRLIGEVTGGSRSDGYRCVSGKMTLQGRSVVAPG